MRLSHCQMSGASETATCMRYLRRASRCPSRSAFFRNISCKSPSRDWTEFLGARNEMTSSANAGGAIVLVRSVAWPTRSWSRSSSSLCLRSSTRICRSHAPSLALFAFYKSLLLKIFERGVDRCHRDFLIQALLKFLVDGDAIRVGLLSQYCEHYDLLRLLEGHVGHLSYVAGLDF